MQRLLLLLVSMLINQALIAETRTAKSKPYQTAVVELYTSEGCSSCPPADRWLAELIKVPVDELDVLALAFHVDYWDYIGWKDEFAKVDYTQRQRHLAAANRQKTIYTPEFFVGGLEARGTSQIVQEIQQTNKTPSSVNLVLKLDIEEDVFKLELAAPSANTENLLVQFVVYENHLGNEVTRGENAGQILHHQRVVRYLSKPLMLSGLGPYQVDIETPWKMDDLGVAAIVLDNQGNYLQSVEITI